jgi:hypothetical protein
LPEARVAAQALIQKVELHFDHEEQGKRRKSVFSWGRVHFRNPLDVVGVVDVAVEGADPSVHRCLPSLIITLEGVQRGADTGGFRGDLGGDRGR